MNVERGRETIRQQNVGQAEINRVSREIHSTIDRNLGFLNEYDIGEGLKYTFLFTSKHYCWELTYNRDRSQHPSRLYWVVECTRYSDEGRTAEKIFQKFQSSGNTMLKLEHVLLVHDALATFVDGLEARFPAAAKRWQPLLDAAAAAKPEPKVRKHRMYFEATGVTLGMVEEQLAQELCQDVELKKCLIEKDITYLGKDRHSHTTHHPLTIVLVEYIEV